MHNTPNLIVISGPTAVGKTALCIKLAKQLNAPILSCDSRQFYRELNIGSAKPSTEELKSATHYFINNKSISDTYTAGDFERDAIQLITELSSENRNIILTGGSGLYLNALLYGLDERPNANESLRTELKELYKEKGIEAIQERLILTNKKMPESFDWKNPQRMMRAIEIFESGEECFHDISKTTKARPFKSISIIINRERDELYHRIEQRVDDMIKEGLLDECKSLIEYRHHYALQTVGYKEMFDFLDGKTSFEFAIDKIKQHTRNYAKRQLTWFRKDTSNQWFEAKNEEAILNYIASKKD